MIEEKSKAALADAVADLIHTVLAVDSKPAHANSACAAPTPRLADKGLPRARIRSDYGKSSEETVARALWKGDENRSVMKPLNASDFRARRFMLERKNFAQASGKYSGPTNLIDEDTWKSIIVLPDDVSIRTSDKYGSQVEQMWEYWGMWGRVVGGVQALSSDPTECPTAMAACDAGDEFQAATYCALVGYYRVAFSCLRNVLEQITIAAQLAISNDAHSFTDWRNGEDRIRFGWAADMLPKNPDVAALERHLKAATTDSLFDQAPKGLARRLFVELSKYTHGAAGFTDADSRQSNGPIFLARTFLEWCVAALKTYAIALHELKLAHAQLDELPWGPPRVRLDELCRKVVADIPSGDKDRAFFQSLVNFWH